MPKANETHTTTRRTALAAIVGTLAAGTPVAGPTLGATADAELLALGPVYDASLAAQSAQEVVLSRVSKLYSAAVPKELFGPPADEELPKEVRQAMLEMTLGEYERMPPDHPVRVQIEAHHKRMEGWGAAQRAARRVYADAVGLDEVQDKFDAIVAKTSDIADEILATPATTVAGLRVKLRAIATNYDCDVPWWWEQFAEELGNVLNAKA